MMTIPTSIILSAILVLAGCGKPDPESITPPSQPLTGSTAPMSAVNREIVSNFFNDLGEEPYTINSHDGTMAEEEDHVFRWVIAAISKTSNGDYSIREIRLSKTTVGSRFSYELTRHTAQGFTELLPGRSYIQLHAVHRASDPELHGVIDGEGPKLLSFFGEGA